MEKFMKFTMYEKESKNEKYRNDPYRAVNFPINESGLPVCPNGKEFHFIYSRPVRGNKYGRTEEYFQCEDCSGCPHKEKCCKCKGNRIVRLNEELTQFHAEVLNNLNSIHGALLRRLYPKICVNHKRALSEISKLMEHFDESRAYS